MKQLFTLALLLLLINISAKEMPYSKISLPISISEQFADSTIQGDSCRFYLETNDYNNPAEVDSLKVSVFFKNNEFFPSFEFFNLLTDDKGKAQVTYLPGKYYVQITKPCTPDFKQNFEFIIEKAKHSRTVTSNITSALEIQLDPNMRFDVVDKPVIYCYPTKEIDVEIELNTEANLTFTYPQLSNSWKTTLYPNGDIEVNNKKYPYLFWEGKLDLNSLTETNEGFIVEHNNTISFFEDKLTQIGLNQREITDFITFWCPKMTEESYQVSFLIGEDYNANIGQLNFSIQPDSEIRIFALITKFKGNPLIEQVLPTIERKGFTVVEWGGSIIQEQKTSI